MDIEESYICHQIISDLCSLLAIARRRKVSKDRAHNYVYYASLQCSPFEVRQYWRSSIGRFLWNLVPES